MAGEVPEIGLVLSVFQAKPLLETKRKGKTSALSSDDLGRTKTEVELSDEVVRFPSGIVSWSLLEEIAKEERKVFRIEGGELHAIHVFSETTGWVRVLCPSPTAPTVLVSGIPMHRIKDTDPMADTRAKLSALGTPRGRLLDTATGLGYTAIAAAKSAQEVVTIELDPAALEIARQNPWSTELFSSPKIRQIVGDAFEEVAKLPSGYFSDVIHDPPTMALGGELYSEAFYEQLHRVMTRGGRLFHYIGDPNSGVGKRAYPGVMKRLGEAGFKKIARAEAAYGVVGVS